jgi:hypothetical protein
VNAKQRREEFVAKAKEAEELAERTSDWHQKESWLRIAREYRELANRQGAK